MVFVSCGQRTSEEVKLGRDVAEVIQKHGMEAFFAQDVHSAGDLNSEIFRALQTCDAFLGILQKRGTVNYEGFPPSERSSVWIQQEISIFAYRMFLEQRSLPIRVYSERGIRREGVMEIAIVNPIEFDQPDEIPPDVDKWLNSREFEDHPLRLRREALFQSRLSRTTEDAQLLLELIAAHCAGPDDFALHHLVRNDFFEALHPTVNDERQLELKFGSAFGTLRAVGLIGSEDDRTQGFIRIRIAKQWWHSVFDEFRRRGRRL